MIDLTFFCDKVLNLWIPDADVAAERPIVLIPVLMVVIPDAEGVNASVSFLNSLIVDVFTTLTTYSSPLLKPPVTVLFGSYACPISIGSLPFWL